MAGKELIINLHGIGVPDRSFEPGESDSIIELSMLEYVLDLAVENSALITVDDGNVSDISVVLPNLKKRNLNASFFVPAAKVGLKGYLTRDDVVTLSKEGMGVGSHGMDHVNLRFLDDRQLELELVESKRILEDILGSPVTSIACPFGGYDRRVLDYIKKAGYKKVYTSDRGWGNLDNWLISRNTMNSSYSKESVGRLFEGGFSFFEQTIISFKSTVKRWR